MLRKTKKDIKVERLNLVPIMDAVFIFIFFLLFSAQFIKIFEIETEAPLVSEVPTKELEKKDPLNLTLKIFNNEIVVRTGIDQNIAAQFFKSSANYKQKLKDKLFELRKSHPDDNFIIISPLPAIKYEEIVEVVDIAQTIPKTTKFIINSKKGEVRLYKLFQQVVLEPLSEND